MWSYIFVAFLFTPSLKFTAADDGDCVALNAEVWNGQNAELSDEEVQALVSVSNTSAFQQLLDPILRVRRVGTPQHDAVRDYLVNRMRSLGWYTEVQTFTKQTPLGRKRFSNVVSTQYPTAVKRFVVACHYDTKSDPQGFVGAIDSAVPCAMMLDLAIALNDTLWRSRLQFESGDFSLQFMFLDGEEALVKWSNDDSLYGARQLAERLAAKRYELPPDYAASANCVSEATEIDRIATFVLLDLIGSRDTHFVSAFAETDALYSQLVAVENDLRDSGLLDSRAPGPLFEDTLPANGIASDDHLPFLERGVPILHLISIPFPETWHTLNDNRASLDWPTIDNLNRILRVFLARYFALQ